MFALAFHFPAGRYHATPWGRNVNEADVAWPPEPWRLLRTLVAMYWRKGDRARWSEGDLARLIDSLAETLPEYSLPTGAVHAHTRHYMPTGTLARGSPKTTLVFDAFLRLPGGSTLVAAWPLATLPRDQFELAADLVNSIGYLGRAESLGGVRSARGVGWRHQLRSARIRCTRRRPCTFACAANPGRILGRTATDHGRPEAPDCRNRQATTKHRVK